MASQCDRIMAILADGEPHEKSEFYGFCVLHSRISELRNERGVQIELEKRDGGYWYRLATLREATESTEGSMSVASRSAVSTEPSSVPQNDGSGDPLVPASPEAASADGHLVGAASSPFEQLALA